VRSPKCLDHREIVHSRHNPINNGNVAIVIKAIAQRITPIRHVIDAVAMLAQTGNEVFGQFQVIFGQQNFHRRLYFSF